MRLIIYLLSPLIRTRPGGRTDNNVIPNKGPIASVRYASCVLVGHDTFRKGGAFGRATVIPTPAPDA